MHVRARRWLGRGLGRAAAVAAGALALLPGTASAADAVGGSVPGYGVLDWLNLAIRLALVVAVIWGAIGALRWYMQRLHGSGPGSRGVVHVLETRPLGPNRALYLVHIGGRVVLLGATPERISRLSEVDDADEVASMIAIIEAGNEARTLPGLLGGVVPVAQLVRERAQQLGNGAIAQWREGRATRVARTARPAVPDPDLLSGFAERVPTVRTADGRRGVRLADLEAAMRTPDGRADR